MPNIIGYSSRDAASLLNFLNIKYDISGVGYVDSQSIAPGTVLNHESLLTVNCSLKYNQ